MKGAIIKLISTSSNMSSGLSLPQFYLPAHELKPIGQLFNIAVERISIRQNSEAI
jgi:hypothetical protein